MLLFGHAGITLGAATLIAGVTAKKRNSRKENPSWFTSLSRFVDIRFLLIGSLLPDIIDKPVGQIFFRETFSSGRIFSHTLLFFIVLFAAGLYIYMKKHKNWLLALAIGSLAHLVLDRMWREPSTLFWPILGLTFEAKDLEYWTSNILKALTSIPEVYIPEAIGFLVIVWFGMTIIFRKTIISFLKSGSI
jgi:hypothetical protein